MKSIAARDRQIAQLREDRGWTQEQLAHITGYSSRTIRNAERGRRVSRQVLADIATALEVPVGDLVTEAEYARISRPNQVVVQQMLQAWSRCQTPAILATLLEQAEVQIHGPAVLPFTGSHCGKQAIATALEAHFAAIGWYAPPTYDVRTTTPEQVLVEGVEYARANKSGSRFLIDVCMVCTLAEGRIERISRYADHCAALLALVVNDSDFR